MTKLNETCIKCKKGVYKLPITDEIYGFLFCNKCGHEVSSLDKRREK